MSENNAETRPQEVLDMERALHDLHAFKNAVAAGTFPGRNAEDVSKLSKFLSETFQQVEAQFRAHPFIQDLIKKSEEASLAKSNEAIEQQAIDQANFNKALEAAQNAESI